MRGPMDIEIYASFNTALTTTSGSLAASVAAAGTIAVGSAVNSVNVPPGTTVGAIVGTAVTLALPPISLMADVQASNLLLGLRKTAGLLGATVVSPYFAPGTTVIEIVQVPVIVPGGQPSQFGHVRLSSAALSLPPIRQPVPITFLPSGNAVAGGVDATAVFTGASIVYSGTVQIERCFDGGYSWLPANIGGAGALAQYNMGTPVSVSFGEPEKSVLYRVNCLAYVSGAINYRISTTGGAAESLSLNSAI